MNQNKQQILKDIWQIANGKSSKSKIGSRSVPHHLRPYEKEIFKRSIEKGYMLLKEKDRPNLENLFFLYNKQLNQSNFFYRETSDFPINITSILDKINSIDPHKYSLERNYLDGYVSKLSPYITHGLVSLPQILKVVKKNHPEINLNNQFIKELAWREYFQSVFHEKGTQIFNKEGLKNKQVFETDLFPKAILEASTCIKSIDTSIIDLYNRGYIHNHSRMWIASLVANLAKTNWLTGANWMFYHLLDGDLASNYLSWQWIAGTFSSKKYYANQENINKFSPKNLYQKNTILDKSYEDLINSPTPDCFQDRVKLSYKTNLNCIKSDIVNNVPTYLYSIWTLNPNLSDELESKVKQKILLLEPSFFRDFPMSEQRISFILAIAKNIKSLKIVVTDIKDLDEFISSQNLYAHDHPSNIHWKNHIANLYPQNKMFPNISGYFPSFSSYWKKVEKLYKF